MSSYYDDPIITSQGTLILEENVDSYIRNIEEEERKKLIVENKNKIENVSNRYIMHYLNISKIKYLHLYT